MTAPAGLVRADQQIDTETYLKAVVTTAVPVTEDADPVVPDLSNDPTAIITANGYDYVIKFYGDVMQAGQIVQANPIALARPEQIITGTVISIPAF